MKSPPEELFTAVAAEVARSGSPGTSVERYGLVPATRAAVDAAKRYQAMALELQDGVGAAIGNRKMRSVRELRALLKRVEVFWTAEWKP